LQYSLVQERAIWCLRHPLTLLLFLVVGRRDCRHLDAWQPPVCIRPCVLPPCCAHMHTDATRVLGLHTIMSSRSVVVSPRTRHDRSPTPPNRLLVHPKRDDAARSSGRGGNRARGHQPQCASHRHFWTGPETDLVSLPWLVDAWMATPLTRRCSVAENALLSALLIPLNWNR
jgi:hypothetical protein